MRVRLQGFDEYARKLRNAPKDVQSEMNMYVASAALDWERGAKRDAPKDQGRLANSIHADGGVITVDAEYAAYMEWGTKTKASVPGWLSSYAQQFKGGVKGGDAKRHIYAWCKRVGVPEEKWFLVFVSIMQKGVKPRPFFFKQKAHVQKKLLSDLKILVDSL